MDNLNEKSVKLGVVYKTDSIIKAIKERRKRLNHERRVIYRLY